MQRAFDALYHVEDQQREPPTTPMKILIAILAAAIIAGSLFADHKWRQWMAARRRNHDPHP